MKFKQFLNKSVESKPLIKYIYKKRLALTSNFSAALFMYLAKSAEEILSTGAKGFRSQLHVNAAL